MNVLTIRNDCAAVTVSAGELETYGMTYESLDYSTDETKFIVRLALEKINDALDDADIYGKSVTVEALPQSDGGCLLIFTFTNSSGKTLKKDESEAYVLQSETIEPLCAFSKTAVGMKMCVSSSLYKRNGNFRLLFFSRKSERERTEHIISEFINVSRGEVYSTYETWEQIIKDDAVFVLADIAL